MQWGKSTSDLCKLCKGRETTCHVLNNCKVALDQGKYIWRHDNILAYIASCLDPNKYQCFIDIPGYQTLTAGTIPVEHLVTPLRPDIVIIDEQKKSMHIFELTWPLEPIITKIKSKSNLAGAKLGSALTWLS